MPLFVISNTHIYVYSPSQITLFFFVAVKTNKRENDALTFAYQAAMKKLANDTRNFAEVLLNTPELRHNIFSL